MAIELPGDVRTALQPVIDTLEPLNDSVRVNSVDRIHLTLHFLGQVAVGQIPSLEGQLRTAVAGCQRFQVTAEGVGAFPNFGRPQVLWAGIGGSGLAQLISLQNSTAGVLRANGVALEDRFHPHLTLARVRRPIRGPARKPFRDWQERWRTAGFGLVPVETVTLFRSQLGAGPPRYSTLAKFELQ